jgi:hypothetical protein
MGNQAIRGRGAIEAGCDNYVAALILFSVSENNQPP